MARQANYKCPKCGSTLFHIKVTATATTIQCYRANACGWSKTLKE